MDPLVRDPVKCDEKKSKKKKISLETVISLGFYDCPGTHNNLLSVSINYYRYHYEKNSNRGDVSRKSHPISPF